MKQKNNWQWSTAYSEKVTKGILRRKLEDWYESLPVNLQEAARRDTVVAGGAIASLLTGNNPNDLDLYFLTFETTKALAEHYVAQFQDINKEKLTSKKVEMSVRSDQEETFETTDSDGKTVSVNKKRVMPFVRSSGMAAEDAKDGDYIYFEGESTGDSADDFVEKIATAAEEALASEKPLYQPVFVTSNAISLRGGIQIVVRFYGKPQEIFDNYDYAHCMGAYIPSGGELIIPLATRKAIMERKLVFNMSTKYPLASLFRQRKFLGRGFDISATELAKIAFRLGEFDLNNFKVLEEQLIGVDIAYFLEFLGKIADRKESGKPINATYLATVLDRMYGG